MLDYGANAVVHWPVEKIIAEFERRCKDEDDDPSKQLATHLGEDREAADFWKNVKTNLEAGRIRMVFVADTIPPALRRIVEFLNEQMRFAEVVAIEIKQFEGKGIKTLVPRVIGQTESARGGKGVGQPPKKQWDGPSLLRSLQEAQGDTAAAAAKSLMEWASPPFATRVWWGEGGETGSFTPVLEQGMTKHYLFRITTKGFLVFRFDWLCRNSPFDDETVGRKLREKIRDLPSVVFPSGEQGASARLPLAALGDPSAVSKVHAVVDWMIETIRGIPGH